ncbi:zinc finger protein 385D [Scomber japonicus]|uniref:zinc finger protein 385D n=1 Tax=Scomber japonicus TaxID=13676 RepID=UPI002305D1AA|nr:zinc finger protein 385D [Scomber japonicus]
MCCLPMHHPSLPPHLHTSTSLPSHAPSLPPHLHTSTSLPSHAPSISTSTPPHLYVPAFPCTISTSTPPLPCLPMHHLYLHTSTPPLPPLPCLPMHHLYLHTSTSLPSHAPSLPPHLYVPAFPCTISTSTPPLPCLPMHHLYLHTSTPPLPPLPCLPMHHLYLHTSTSLPCYTKDTILNPPVDAASLLPVELSREHGGRELPRLTRESSANDAASEDGLPGVVALPLSPILRPPQSLPSLAILTTPTPAPVTSPLVPSTTAATAPETTSAGGGDERPSQLNSPSEPDLELEAEPETETDAETEEEKARRLLYCSLCKVAVNSASQLEAHNSGTKHKTMLEARSGVGSIKSFPRPGVKSKLATTTKSATGLQNKTFYCETCDVHVNSETQLKQHISSRRHKDRAAGKPAKPKYSPYSKPQKGQTKQPIKLTLGKERQCQTLTSLIPAHLAAVAAAAAAALGNTFTHRTNPATNHTPTPALFQTQTLPAALLRPAPGPVRTSHPQVLFAPY